MDLTLYSVDTPWIEPEILCTLYRLPPPLPLAVPGTTRRPRALSRGAHFALCAARGAAWLAQRASSRAATRRRRASTRAWSAREATLRRLALRATRSPSPSRSRAPARCPPRPGFDPGRSVCCVALAPKGRASGGLLARPPRAARSASAREAAALKRRSARSPSWCGKGHACARCAASGQNGRARARAPARRAAHCVRRVALGCPTRALRSGW